MANDPTKTNFDEWLDLNHHKVYIKYENNPFKIVVWSLRKQNRGDRGGQKLRYPRLFLVTNIDYKYLFTNHAIKKIVNLSLEVKLI
jgi:hypothetical protein